MKSGRPSKKILWIGSVIVIIVVASLISAHMRQSTSPSLTVLSPKSGETWRVGSTHTITWTTHNIPGADKISVMLRRLPPPPLPAEGQEFDPIVFTNLENTGSTTWTISSQYPAGTYVLELLAYTSLPITSGVSAESEPFTIATSSLSKVLYPLYDKVTWGIPEPTHFTIGSTTYSGTGIVSIASANTMDPGSIFTPFQNYYDQKLKAEGWTVANDLAAGGHLGGQTGYRKGSSTILTGFHIDYHVVSTSSPSECPCDVTLSLFSTTP